MPTTSDLSRRRLDLGSRCNEKTTSVYFFIHERPWVARNIPNHPTEGKIRNFRYKAISGVKQAIRLQSHLFSFSLRFLSHVLPRFDSPSRRRNTYPVYSACYCRIGGRTSIQASNYLFSGQLMPVKSPFISRGARSKIIAFQSLLAVAAASSGL